jgi:multidrug efflux system membrane fusion protein
MTVLVAIVLVVLGVIWFATGPGLTKRPSRPAFISRSAADLPAPTATSVRVASSQAQAFAPAVVVHGITDAIRQVTLRSEIDGLIVALPIARGEAVGEGEEVARIAVGNRQAHLREADARLEHRVLQHEATARLHKQGYRAEAELAEAQALLESARREREQALKALADTRIRAPFSGVLERRNVELGDYVDVGDEVASVLDLNEVIVRARVAERERARLRIGQPAVARLLDGRDVEGQVHYMSAVADEQTRTFDVEIRLKNSQRTIVAGQSVQLTIPGASVAAHRIPSSVLGVDESGRLGVKLVDRQARVNFRTVEVLAQTGTGVWAANLPENTQLIVFGQELVEVGDVVNVVDIGPLRTPSR